MSHVIDLCSSDHERTEKDTLSLINLCSSDDENPKSATGRKREREEDQGTAEDKNPKK